MSEDILSTTVNGARIKRIMQNNKNVGKLANPVPFLISKSLDIFIEDFLTLINEKCELKSANISVELM
ncbi:hypothetical protein MXB_2866 [Myxobolus squamalis]|nr:hypothetical protein MXB_2866 [Myxobolus squamalis]